MINAQLFSAEDKFSTHIIKSFNEKKCDVHVVGTDISVNYILANFTNLNTQKDILKQTEKIKSKLQVGSYIKTCIILPYTVNSKKEDELRDIIVNSFNAIVKNIWFLYVGVLAEDIAENKKLVIPSNENEVFIIDSKTICNELIRNLFGFGFPRRENLLTKKINLTTNDNRVERLNKVDHYFKKENILSLKPIEIDESLYKYKIEIRKVEIKKVIKIVEVKINKPKEKKILKKKLAILGTFVFVWIIVLPFIWIALSGAALLISYEEVKLGNTSSQTLAVVGKNLGSLAKFQISPIVKIPIIEYFWRIPFVIAFSEERAGLVLENANIAKVESQKIFKGIFTDSDYDISKESETLHLALDTIYKESSFLETDLQSVPFIKDKIVGSKDKISSIKNYLNAASVVSQKLPLVLGDDKRKTYLILFQNNAELRPGGGFIGSFALVTFDKGKMIDMEILDVYDADGQLKGHVEPPAAIKKYLGEANWYLRDSNWDSNWGVTADRAKWFIEKELDRGVDGVIGVDVEVARTILKELGPADLTDIGEKIDYKNIYEKLQNEIESNFFPGSRKKANILTALGKSLIDKLENINQNDYEKVSLGLLDNLNSKDIQIEVDNSELQDLVGKLNWDGALRFDTCLYENCQTATVGLVEANVGVNKVNYYIKRNMEVSSEIKDSLIKFSLIINYESSASQEMGISGNYKNYLRLITGADAHIDDVITVDNKETTTLKPEQTVFNDRLESGVLINIPASEKRTVTFTWTEPVNVSSLKDGALMFRFIKQPGTKDDGLVAKFTYPSLTQVRSERYNTILTEDFTKIIFWKGKL